MVAGIIRHYQLTVTTVFNMEEGKYGICIGLVNMQVQLSILIHKIDTFGVAFINETAVSRRFSAGSAQFIQPETVVLGNKFHQGCAFVSTIHAD